MPSLIFNNIKYKLCDTRTNELHTFSPQKSIGKDIGVS